MAAAGSEEIDQSAWEMSKENVQPVRSGRSVNCISTAFQPSRQAKDKLSLEKQKFEEEILAGDNLEDPLDPWDRYLKWTIQNCPSGGSDANLLHLLRKYISKFLSVDRYKNDPRHVAAWLKLAEIIRDPLETYSYMNTQGIGTKRAEFYVAWADEYEKYKDFKKCDRIYLDGDEKCAQPREHLQKMHTAFQLRVARTMEEKIKEGQSANNIDDGSARAQHRSAFSGLSGRGKHQTVGSQRTGGALQAHHYNQGSSLQSLSGNEQPKASAFQIYEETQDGVHVMGETGQWGSAPSGHTKNENELPAGPWKGVKMKQKHVRSEVTPSVPAPPMSNFAVFNEGAGSSECEGTSSSRKVASNIESVLSTKKASHVATNSFNDLVNERPVHESTNVVSAYCVDKVYSVMGEMQFEEIRAAHWRKKQRRKEEAEARRLLEEQQRAQEEEKTRMEKLLFEKQQQLEKERRRRDEERLILMELERRQLEEERKRIMERQLELKNRPAELQSEEKSANALEKEQRMLRAEEEDVTMQLSKVNRNLKDLRRRSITGWQQENPPASSFPIYDENEGAPGKCEAEGMPALTAQATHPSTSLKQTTLSGAYDQFRQSQPSPTLRTEVELGEILNCHQQPPSESHDEPGLSNSSIQRRSSLNGSSFDQSRRSQPSPTVYTKEAMGEVLNWFQKPLLQSHSETCDMSDVAHPIQIQPHSFRPVTESVSQPSSSVPLSAVKQHGGAFAIFSEDDCTSENRSDPKQPAAKQRGLSEVLPLESRRELQMGMAECETLKTMQAVDGDKTGSCFDDVTVAGSHFAARAHLASTPFCGRTEKLQNITDFHQLSCIEPAADEHAENAEPESQKQALPSSVAECTLEEGASCEQQPQMECQENQYGEIKQLSPIMEASNESEKSSVMRSKSSRSDSESDKTHFPATQERTRGEPLRMKSFGASIFHKTPERAVSTEARDEFLGDAINCDLWGDDEMTEHVPAGGARVSDKRSLDQPVGGISEPNNFSEHGAHEAADEVFRNDMLLTEEVADLTLACAKFDLAATKNQENGASSVSKSAASPALKIVANPWDEKFQASIIARSRVFEGGDIDVHFVDGALIPKLRKGMSLTLGDKSYKVGKLLGKGGYAKVFDTVSTDGPCKEVIKFQSPACPWEVYAIAQAKSRLRAKGMHAEATALVDVVSSHIYDDGSMLVVPYFGNGTLLDMINSKKGTRLKEKFAVGIAYRVLRIVHGLHKVGIIHGDIKPDNFMLESETADFTCMSNDDLHGLKLIDFGRAIDMCEVPDAVAFHLNCGTSGFTCIQMQNKQPWNYHIDFYGIAGTIHVVLLGSYMKVHQDENGMWTIAEKLKRWHDAELWNDFFSTLLNFPTPTSDRPVGLADSPLPRLISKMLDAI